MTTASEATNPIAGGRHDFDFLVGTWHVSHRKLAYMTDPACSRWVEFEGVSAPGHLDSPVSGRWEGKRGLFEGTDVVGGKPVDVRFEWTVYSAGSAQWEQAFSFDGGRSWVHNWRMTFTRLDPYDA